MEEQTTRQRKRVTVQPPVRRKVRLSVPAAEGLRVLLLRQRLLEQEAAAVAAMVREHMIREAGVNLDDGDWTLDLDKRQAIQR